MMSLSKAGQEPVRREKRTNDAANCPFLVLARYTV